MFVKIPKDLLCEISELTVNQEGETEYPEGTIFKVDDKALVQVVNFDPDGDSFDGELFFRNETEDESEQVEGDQEIQYEAVNVSDYTTYVIASDRDEEEEEEGGGGGGDTNIKMTEENLDEELNRENLN